MPPWRLSPLPVNVPSFNPTVASAVAGGEPVLATPGAKGVEAEASALNGSETALVFERPAAYTTRIAAVLMATTPLDSFPLRDRKRLDSLGVRGAGEPVEPVRGPGRDPGRLLGKKNPPPC